MTNNLAYERDKKIALKQFLQKHIQQMSIDSIRNSPCNNYSTSVRQIRTFLLKILVSLFGRN